MRFPPTFLDELRARLPVSEVVGRRVKLRKAGREWKGLSPFNKEKTPSFTVNDQKGFFHDFSSGKSGDIFRFMMETEGVTFPEAVERLAGMAGLTVPAVSREAAAAEERRNSLHDVMELAAQFFEGALAGRPGAPARHYLDERGLGIATRAKFRLGYAPAERFALKEHLGGQGVSVDDMVTAGLLIAGDDIPVPYDRFRGRVMFPIADARGRVIAFGGRALAPDAPAKYLNSPETPLFHKGATLYNLAGAKAAAHGGAPVIAAEGYIDVIALVEAGFPGAVAPLGTALTEAQLALLWKMADEPVLCFDGDGAGRRAAYRAIDLAVGALTAGKSLRFAQLPAGQDPDDLARSGGRAAIEAVIAAAVPLGDLLWTRETEAQPHDTPERRAALEQRLTALSDSIRDPIVRKHYRDDLAGRLRTLLGGDGRRFQRRPARNDDWRNAIRAARGRPERPPYGGTQVRGFADVTLAPSGPIARSSLVNAALRIPVREALILFTVLNYPWLLDDHAEDLAEIELRHPEADRLRRGILDAAAGHGAAPLDPALLREALTGGGLSRSLAQVEAAITHTSDWPARPGASESDVIQWWSHLTNLHRKQRTLHRELKDAERALGDAATEENLNWLRDLQERLAALDGSEAIIEDFGIASGRMVRGA